MIFLTCCLEEKPNARDWRSVGRKSRVHGDFLTVNCRKDSIWTLRDLSGQCMTSTGRGDWLGGPWDLPSFLCVLCSKTGSPHSVDLQVSSKDVTKGKALPRGALGAPIHGVHAVALGRKCVGFLPLLPLSLSSSFWCNFFLFIFWCKYLPSNYPRFWFYRKQESTFIYARISMCEQI